MIKAILLLLLCVSAVFAITGINVNGAECEQPDTCCMPNNDLRCNSQAREVSCTNWHGCKWSCSNNKCERRKVGNTKQTDLFCKQKNCCTFDATCETKATVVPTNAPTPPTTQAPTVPTNAPTPAPTRCEDQPPNGCIAVKKQTACKKFTCCQWANNKCGERPPTAAPTPAPTQIPCFHLTGDNDACKKRKDCMVNKIGNCVKSTSG